MAAPTTSTTQPATAATTRATTTASVNDVAALARLTGHDFTAEEIALMAEDVASNREKLLRLHSRHIDPRVEPAVHFDPRLPGVEYPSGGESSFRLSDGSAPEYHGDVKSLAFATAAELSRLIHARKITSVELTKMYLDRLDTVGRKLNAVINLCPELALRQAEKADRELQLGRDRGPLHGVPYGAKDLLATKGIPTTWGISPMKDNVFDYDATVVKKLEDAGAVLCAKLSLGELAMGDVWFGGQTKTPWDKELKRGSSGSSAGPAACVAAGCVAFAIGSETMGSIVSPCMTNGVTGLRPTYGRVSRYGAMPLSRTMDKLGPMARGVEDCAMILAAINGPDDLDPTAARDVPFRFDGSARPKLRIGYDVAAFAEVAKTKNARKKAAYQQALETVRGLGDELVPVHLPDAAPYKGLPGLIIAAESASSFTELVNNGDVRKLVQQGDGAWPNEFRHGSLIPASDYLRAMQLRTQLMRDMHDAMRDVDLYVTIPYVGPTIYITNTTGHPTLVTRCGMLDDHTPLMLEFLAQPYREDAALSLALAYERSTSSEIRAWPRV